jgi:2-amino-4-hydroxy-6-hydroxymethyldihydropteridine diphosphokinase
VLGTLGSSFNAGPEPKMGIAYIGIGSNVDRENNIRSAVNKLSRLGRSLQISPVYESPAYGFKGDNFYNLVVGLETVDTPEELNSKLQQIENEQGRDRTGPRFSSRTVDLDLLLYDNLVIHNDHLNLPRQDIESYEFVLFPLADIAAEFVHPEKGVKIGEIRVDFKSSNSDIWQVQMDLAVSGDLSA